MGCIHTGTHNDTQLSAAIFVRPLQALVTLQLGLTFDQVIPDVFKCCELFIRLRKTGAPQMNHKPHGPHTCRKTHTHN